MSTQMLLYCRRLRGLFVLLGVLVLTIPSLSNAEPPSKSEIRQAKKLAKKANRLERRGKWVEAIALLEEAEKLNPIWEYSAALAAGHLKTGKRIIAWEALGRTRKYGVPPKKQPVVDKLAADIEAALLTDHAFLDLKVVPADARVRINGEQWRPPYRRWVKGSLSTLTFEHGDYLDMKVNWHHPAGHKASKSVTMISKSSYGRVEVEGYPAGAIVTLDGKDIGTLPKVRTGLLAPGSYTVSIRQKEFDTQTKEVVVRAGTVSTVAVKLEESDSPAAKLLKSRRFWGWTTVGIGAAALGASIGLLAHGATIREDMVNLNKTHVAGYASYVREYDELNSDYETMSTTGYALLGVGVALAATGTTLLVLDYTDDEADSARWQVSPTMTGFNAQVSF